MFRILAIAGTLLGLASVAQADVWRWTDPNGTIHYSDSWVPGSTLVKTDSRANYSAPSSAPAASAPSSGPAAPADQSQAERDKRTVAADVAKTTAEQCKKAKEDYDRAIQARRIYKGETAGQRQYLNDAEADAYRLELLNTRKQICGS